MAAGNTFTAIATQTLGSAAASVTFSSIPSTYTDLVLVIQGGDTGGDNSYVRVNGDTATNYSFTTLNGNGTTAATNRVTNATAFRSSWYAYQTNNMNWNGMIHFMNYSNATTYKTMLLRDNNASTGTEAMVALWRSTSAINSINLYWGSTDTWATGSTFSLYGILAA